MYTYECICMPPTSSCGWTHWRYFHSGSSGDVHPSDLKHADLLSSRSAAAIVHRACAIASVTTGSASTRRSISAMRDAEMIPVHEGGAANVATPVADDVADLVAGNALGSEPPTGASRSGVIAAAIRKINPIPDAKWV